MLPGIGRNVKRFAGENVKRTTEKRGNHAEGRGCGYGGLFPRPFRAFCDLSWGRTGVKSFPAIEAKT
jgi:hypothetical protein